MRKWMIILLEVLFFPWETKCDHACPAVFRMQPSDKTYRHPANLVNPGLHRFTLVGIFPISGQDCQRILEAKAFSGFQRAEAMIYGLNKVNKEVREGKRKVALDGYILDSCINGISASASLHKAVEESEPVAG